MANKDDASIKGAAGGKPVAGTAPTAQAAAAPAGAGANGSDTAGNYVITLATINNNRTRIEELVTVLQAHGMLPES